ncbi:MAG: hypothetical protein PHS54_02400 [Clostridia bacterium]|nr:hypothetical protein [Clostridia bacterium]
MNNILQCVEQVFNEKTLIGNHDFTENEYSLMVDSVGALGDKFEKKSYKLIFATLVEIAKRWKQSDTTENDEENRGYWDYVFKTLFGSEIDQLLCQKYRNVISWLGKNSIIPVVTSGQNYYATLMMHSYAPKNSVYSFFDLCYNIFKKDLDFGFTSDDEWLCLKVAEQMKNVLGGGYSEDKKVSIGSSAYSIKIGLRSFALNEDLSADFVEFIKDTFYQINKLFNKEKVLESTRLDRYILEWWKNKTETEKMSDETILKKRVSTVSKQNIVVKYIRNDKDVFLCIPSIRLDDDKNTLWLKIYVNGNHICSEEMSTKRGELVVATKQKEFEVNDLLKRCALINIRIVITENKEVIFDSEKNKTTTLNREFILFDGENEIFSQINKPTNYFVYSKDIDSLKSTPAELTTYSINLYNIYPIAGENLTGDIKQVFFVNKETAAKLGNSACLIGSLTDVEWLLDDISCVVYGNSVKLMVPINFNLKALELRIDRKSYKLLNLKYEQLENNCYQFGLKAMGLISKNEPIEISLYSYEKEATLFSETIIAFPNFSIQFNKLFYFGHSERKVVISNDNEINELTWTDQDNEIKFPIKDGILVIKIPYFRWRIDGREWHKEPINRKLWFKDFLVNGDLLEIDIPKEVEEIKIYGKAYGKSFEIIKNQNGKHEIGRAIYTNDGIKDISVFFSSVTEKFELFNVATKEHFLENPIIYRNGKVFWDVENTFIGERDNDFFLIVKGDGDNSIRTKIGMYNKELNKFEEDIYKIVVKIKDKNIFSREENYQTIFEGRIIVGIPEKFRFKNKKLFIKEVSTAFSDVEKNCWIRPYATYMIQDLEYIEEQDNGQSFGFYIGKLASVKDNKIIILNFMENEDGEKDRINPVRLEMRSNNSFWLVAGYDLDNNEFLGELIFDNIRRGLCNINSNDRARYKVINLYKFKEEDNV